MSDFYSKETVDAKLEAIHSVMIEVREQTKKTNGRVTSLEKWRWGITGGLIILGGIGAANVSMLAKLFISVQ